MTLTQTNTMSSLGLIFTTFAKTRDLVKLYNDMKSESFTRDKISEIAYLSLSDCISINNFTAGITAEYILASSLRIQDLKLTDLAPIVYNYKEKRFDMLFQHIDYKELYDWMVNKINNGDTKYVEFVKSIDKLMGY